MRTLFTVGFLAALTLTARAQTVPQLYDRLDEAARQKNPAKQVEVYKVFFIKKKNLASWDFLRGAQAAAQSQQTELAFTWLERMLALGWRDADLLEKDVALSSLHGDPRWVKTLERTRMSVLAARESLDPASAGVAANPSVDEAERWMADPTVDAKSLYQKLAGWKGFPRPSETGRWLRFENKISDTLTAPYFVYVPSGYDPNKPTGLLVYLRGGIGSPDFPTETDPDYLVENPLQSYCEENNLLELFPQGSSKVFWTSQTGMKNVADQLKAVRQRFFLDDDRVFLAGFSNGGSGVYAFALNAPTPFAGLFSINGQLGETICLPNLTNRPLFTLASENDDYSDVGKLKKLHALAKSSGAPWTLTELPGQGHYYRPYEDEAFPSFFASLKTLRRSPLPQTISWETADPAAGRCDWLQIDELDLAAPRAFWHAPPPSPVYAIERNGRRETRDFGSETGAVRASVTGNHFALETSRVARLTLYFSPEQVDFSRLIDVTLNGKPLWHGRISIDKTVASETFRESFDRQRVFGAKKTFELPTVRLNEKLREELLTMAKRDQAMQMDPKVNPIGPGRDARIKATFRENNRRLHAIFQKFGWPSERVAGKDGSNAAWLLVQHADEDKPLQRLALQLLDAAVRKGEASKGNLAYLTDRVRMNAGQKQVYGTQLVWLAADNPQPKPTEDIPNLNKRRAEMGMETIEEYLKTSLQAMREIRKQLEASIGKGK